MTRWTEGVRREVLPNGLTVLAQRIAGAPAVAVQSAVRAGFFDEPDRLAGVSHVLEHMLFKGTSSRGVGDIPRETRSAGGSLNAGTGYDHTTYITTLPPGALRLGLELQSDALRRSTIDGEELRRELIVIKEEAKRKLDTPAAVCGETLHQLLFDRHRIRRWRIGSEEQLDRITRDEVIEFYRSYYVPSETVVVMAGELDPEQAGSLAREYYGDWPAEAARRDPSPAEPDRHEVRARTLRGDLTRGDLALGWRTVDRFHPDAIPLDVAALVLSAGRSSWLYQGVRVPGAMTSVGASHFTPREVGLFSIAGELDPGRLTESLEKIAGCLRELRDHGPGEGDMLRVRTLLEASWARRLESVEGRAGALAAAAMDGDYRLLDEDFARLLGVTGEEVQRVAREWLDPDAVSGVAYLPERQGDELTADRLKETLANATVGKPRRQDQTVGWDGSRTAERTAGPPDGRTAGGSGPSSGVLHIPLAGVDLLLQHKPSVPLVSLGLYQRRHRTETAGDAGLGMLAIRCALRGAGEYDAAGLALAFEGLGGVLGLAAGIEWFGLTTSVLGRSALSAVALLDLVFRHPVLDQHEVAREQRTLLDGVLQDADDMSRYPVDLAFRARFGPSGYGLPVHGIPDSVRRLSSQAVRDWHRSMLEAPGRRPLLVAVGQLDPERFGEAAARIFESYPARVEDRRPITGLPPVADSPLLVEARSKRQTALSMLFPGPNRASPARHAALVWSAIAGGLGGRLFVALRDRLSLAYVVRASTWQRSGAGALLLYLATSPEREEEARSALLSELARFREAPPDPEELGRATRYVSGQILIGRQTASAILGELAEAWLSRGEEGLREVEDPLAGIRLVTGESIRDLALQSFRTDQMVEGIVRGMAEATMLRSHGSSAL